MALVGVQTLLLSSPAAAADDACKLEISGNDQMQYDKKELAVPATCKQVTLTLHHTGQLPAAAMGHDWVLVNTPDLNAVANAGMGAGLASNYIAAGDKHVLANTKNRGRRTVGHGDVLDRQPQGGWRLLLPVHLPRSQRADARQVQVRLIQRQEPAVDQRIADLLTLLELEQLEVNLFRGDEPRYRQPAGVRRASARTGPLRRFGDGRGSRRSIRCMPTFCAGATSTPRSSTRSTAAWMARASRTAGSSPSNTASRFLI